MSAASQPNRREEISQADYDEAADRGYAIGAVAFQESLPGRFTEKAGAAFAAGDDKAAHLYRALAKEFKVEAEKARADFNAEYHGGKQP